MTKLFFIALVFLTTSCRASYTTPEIIVNHDQQPIILPGHEADWPEREHTIRLGQDLRFETISVEHGLSQSTVFCMLQDRQGFLWFGTEDGLNKYDGYSFTIFKHNPEDPNSLDNNWIQVLYEDYNGIIWIGSINGLDRFDPVNETFTHYQNDPDDTSSLSHNNVTSIVQDQDGALWIGTDGGGLNKFDQNQNRFVQFTHDPDDPNSLNSNYISVIIIDYSGVFWIGTKSEGLNRFDHQKDQWIHFQSEDGNPHSLSDNKISAITEDESGGLWIGTNGGGLNNLVHNGTDIEGESGTEDYWESVNFLHYQNDPNDPYSLSSNDVTSLLSDRDGYLWIGTRSGGVNVFVPELESFSSFRSIPSNPKSLGYDWIQSILQDREGTHWFGTIGGGVSKLNSGWRNFALYNNIPNNSNSLSNDMVRTFYLEDEETLWVGSMFGGLDQFDRETGNWQHYLFDQEDESSLSDNFISTIFRDSSGNLWLGTASGLDHYDREIKTFIHYQVDPDAPPGSLENNVRAIHEDRSGVFWIGTRNGLFRFEPDRTLWHGFDYSIPGDDHNLNNVWIVSIFEDNEGMLWVGTWGSGLFRIDPETEMVTHYHHDPDDRSSLGSDILLQGIHAQNGFMWFGTVTGLNRFDPATNSFTQYGEKDGLPNEVIYCILEDDQGFLWLSTNKGITKFDPKNEVFQTFDLHDGLQSDEFNGSACLLGAKGELFFGGIKGFNAFFPDHVTKNPYIPPVVITSISIDGNEVDLIPNVDEIIEVTLRWPQNAFEFEYAALSYNQPLKNQYAYYLEGFEATWKEVGTRRYGQFTNLPGGTYTLRVKGSNNDGVWNEIGSAVKVTVIPPFWAAWWFQGILIVIVLGLAFGGYRLRVRNIESRSRDLENLVEERTAELLTEIEQREQIEEALRASEMEKVVTEERSRLARELHDSVTQSLYSLTLFTEAARHMAEESGSEEIEQTISQIGKIGLHALKEMRLLVFELRPPELEKEGLASAIRRRLEAVEGRAGVDARLVVDDIFKLSGEVEQEFFRIAQEALNNSLKHATASSVVVNLRQEDGCVEMEIVDDGVGFTPSKVSDSGGMGLLGIQERVKGLGGEVEIQSAPGEGSSIKISIDDSSSEK